MINGASGVANMNPGTSKKKKSSKKKGKKNVRISPFHDDTQPAMTVIPGKQY